MRFAVSHLPALAPALVLPLLLAACTLPGGFPSLSPRPAEAPRQIEAPGEGVAAGLSAEERRGLAADLARERQALAETDAAIGREQQALDRLLAGPGVAARGSAAWSNAQMQWSRLDAAAQPLDSIRARLVSSQRLVDSLPATDPDRQAVEALVAEAARIAAATERRQAEALRLLGA